jgi:predicted transcriptional regulator
MDDAAGVSALQDCVLSWPGVSTAELREELHATTEDLHRWRRLTAAVVTRRGRWYPDAGPAAPPPGSAAALKALLVQRPGLRTYEILTALSCSVATFYRVRAGLAAAGVKVYAMPHEGGRSRAPRWYLVGGAGPTSRVLEHLRANGSCTVDDLAAALEMRDVTARRLLRALGGAVTARVDRRTQAKFWSVA